jgi:hypothetical protein
MSINVPSAFSKEDFKKLTNKKLNNDNFQQYKKLFTDNYKCPKGADEYSIKEGLSDELLAKLDYILKRIEDKKQFDSIKDIAEYFRLLLEDKKYIVLFAYNGTGKTRLSVEFKSLGQQLIEETGEKTADTLYYNAFTEDLFYWDNDLNNDAERLLKINSNSRFFSGLKDLEMESRIRPLLHRYADFDFTINYEDSAISFFRNVLISGTAERVDNIKISRGEENIFIWCFFLAIVQLVVDKVESYSWVKYIYVDDPISSLDDNNAIAVASHLARLMSDNGVKVIVSSHHALFFNVLCNEISNAEQMFLQRDTTNDTYILKDTRKTPFFHHVALLKELKKAADTGELYAYHFNILRNILEKTASFHGHAHFSSCIRKGENEDEPVHKRMLDLLSHGNYSLFDPKDMVEDNKEHFKRILNNFLDDYNFNQNLFKDEQGQETQE